MSGKEYMVGEVKVVKRQCQHVIMAMRKREGGRGEILYLIHSISNRYYLKLVELPCLHVLDIDRILNLINIHLFSSCLHLLNQIVFLAHLLCVYSIIVL